MKRPIPKEIVSPMMKYVRPGLNLHRVEEIKAIFDIFDSEKAGKINPRVFKQALLQSGKQVQGTPLYQLACDMDQEGKGWIDFEHFLFFLNENVTGEESQDEMKNLFALFDDQKTGFISITGLRRICKYLHLHLDEIDISEMMKQADIDQDGFVSFQQFHQILSLRI